MLAVGVDRCAREGEVRTMLGRRRRIERIRDRAARMGASGREHVMQNFLLTRQLREYLTLTLALLRGAGDRIELS